MKSFNYFLLSGLVASTISMSASTLPTGMVALTPAGVEVTTTNQDNITKCEKPVVKTSDNKIFFTATDETAGEELWVSDGTQAGTKMVKDIVAGVNGSNPKWLTAVGNKVFFVATSEDAGEELWVTDGTEAGTRMVMDIYEGTGSSSPFGLTECNGKLLFFAMDEESEFIPVVDSEKAEKWLWVSDGTEAGTKRIGDVPTKETNLDNDHGVIIPMGGKGYFIGYDLENNETLWVTDGTQEGTKVVKNINPRETTGTFATAPAAIDWMTAVGNRLVFRAETVSEVTGTADVGNEIWISDGTEAGTKWIGFDFAKGETSGIPTMTQFASTKAYGNTLYFRATDGVHGVEPCVFFVDQPIEEGVNPRMVDDVNHWSNNAALPSWPTQFALYKDNVYIQANGGYYMPDDATQYASGYSLWRYSAIDNSKAMYQRQIWGTEIFAGNKADKCCWFREVDGKLYFQAMDAANNSELWVIANSETAPAKVVDLDDDGQPCQLLNVNNDLCFASTSTKALYYYTLGGSSVEKATTDVKVSVYPNPATDVINVTSSEEVSNIKVYDVKGQCVAQTNVASNLSVANLANGLYIVKVDLANGDNAVCKVIKK